MQNTINFIKSISDKNRLLILYVLFQETLCVCDLQSIIPLSQGALSIQLKKLLDLSLLDNYKKGKWVFYHKSQKINSEYLKIINLVFKDIENDEIVIETIKKLNLTRSKECQ